MERLLCLEQVVDTGPPAPKRAFKHETLLNDKRVLRNLLAKEDAYMPSGNYFVFQQELRPYMRTVLTKWMLDVCEEQHQEEEVFPLSVNLLDRFLTSVQTKKTRLQLLGCVCLFVASKLFDTVPLTAEKLVIYTDWSITVNDLLLLYVKEWEMLVLQVLRYDICAITPHDFVDLLLSRLAISDEQATTVRQHTQTFIALCTTEFSFVMRPPSLIAAACICTAVNGLTGQSCQRVVRKLNRITAIDEDCIRCCQEQIEEAVSMSLQAEQQSSSMEPAASGQYLSSSHLVKTTSPVELPTTPTDIREVRPD